MKNSLTVAPEGGYHAAVASAERAVAAPSAVPVPGRGFYAHVGTSNTSFLKISRLLAEAGVHNNKFMLALLDPGLADVDPRSDSLTDDEQMRVIAESVRNPWYFVREVVLVPVPGGTVPFELHLGNLFLLWCMAANINCFLLLPRQNYKTVSACAFYMWAYCFGTSNSHMLFFNKELGDAKNNLKRVKNMMDELPKWMLDGVLVDPVNDLNNIEYLQSGHRGNRIDAKPAGKDPTHADKLGRGATTPLLWYDEIAFAKYIRETYMAAAPAGSKAKELAKQKGRPFGTCVTTTPNMLNDPSGEFAYQLLTGALKFRLEFYDLGPKRVLELIDSQAEYPFLFAQYTYKELGRDEKWFRTQCRELMNDQLKIKRELLLVWPMSGEGAVFTEEQLDELLRHQGEIAASMPVRPRGVAYIPPGLEITFTEMPDPSVPYLMGVDTASGEGRDYTSFTLAHPDDLHTVGNLRTNTADDEAIKALATHIMMDLFPKAIAIVERNYLGIVVVKHLLRDPATATRVFYLDKEKEAEKTVGVKGRAALTRRKTRVYGIDTTVTSREAMIRHLLQTVEELPHLVTHPIIQDQIRTLQRKKNGKIEHRQGFHDDDLMAYLLCVYADRHEQPVLRRLLSQARSDRTQVASSQISALNVSDGRSAIAARAETPDLEMDEYVQEANNASQDEERRRRRMSALITSLNDGGQEMPL